MSELMGNLIDAQGVTYEPRDGELITGIVVVMRGIEEDGNPFVRSTWSDGMDFITRRGMLEIARDQEVTYPAGGDDE